MTFVPDPPASIGWGAGTAPGTSEGWAAAYWGAHEFGATLLQIVSALAIAENVIQVVFTAPIYLSGLQDVPDASNPGLFTMTVAPGTVGMDGNPVRQSNVVSVVKSPLTDLPKGVTYGASLDLTLDRPMTPWPAAYTITCTGIFVDAGGIPDLPDLTSPIDPTHNSFLFPALFKQISAPSVNLPSPTRDIANPQSLSNAQGTPNPFNPLQLGVYTIDDNRDYAADSGIQSFKKRYYRRLVTKPGAFLHLGNAYGVGIPQEGKKLSTAAVQQRLASQVEAQVSQEPEVQAIRCVVVNDVNVPGLVRFNSRIQLKNGKTVQYSAPFQSAL